MSKNPGPNKQNLELTRSLFLKKGRLEFVKYGYADASTNRIVESSNMARGSLYYHFGDKQGLFAAVYRELLIEMEKSILKEMKKVSEPFQSLKKGCEVYIDLCLRKDVRRLILESYTALNYQERLKIQRETLLGTLQDYMTDVMKAGYFKGQDPMITTILIYGMISEAGRSFELTDMPETLHKPIVEASLMMLEKMAK